MPIVEKVRFNHFKFMASVNEIREKEGPLASYKDVTIDFETAKQIAIMLFTDAISQTREEEY